MSTDRGHPVGIPPNEGSFSSLNATAQAVIAAMIENAVNGPSLVRCVQSSLWLGTDDGEFTIFSSALIPPGKEFIPTEIMFRSLGTMVAMLGLTLDLKYKAETEPDPSSTMTVAFNDLDLIPADDVPITARISLAGGLSDRLNRRGAMTVECATLRAHDVWIDVIGYFVDYNNES